MSISTVIAQIVHAFRALRVHARAKALEAKWIALVAKRDAMHDVILAAKAEYEKAATELQAFIHGPTQEVSPPSITNVTDASK